MQARHLGLVSLTIAGSFAIAAVPAIADSAANGRIVQPFVTPIGTKAPAAAQHVSALESLNDPAADLVSLVADTIYSLGSDLGFAGQIVSAATHSISLYWKGPLPDPVTRYLSTASGLGVGVTVSTGARFTRTEEQTATTRLIESPVTAAARISSASANSSGSGITVQMIGAEPDPATKRLIADAAGLPESAVSYEVGMGEIVPLSATRNNDVAPWKGGGRIIFGSIEGCSSGFAVLAGTAGRLLSAAHCSLGSSLPVTDGVGTTIAPASGVALNNSIDSLSIDPTASPATSPTIFTGAWNSGSVATVKNWSSNWNGDPICFGGATTGTHCGTVADDSVAYPGHTGLFYVKARANSGSITGGGDSGGPVYKVISGGVQARGIVLGGYLDSQVVCPTHNPDVNPTCYNYGIYLPISVALNSWGYSLEVG